MGAGWGCLVEVVEVDVAVMVIGFIAERERGVWRGNSRRD